MEMLTDPQIFRFDKFSRNKKFVFYFCSSFLCMHCSVVLLQYQMTCTYLRVNLSEVIDVIEILVVKMLPNTKTELTKVKYFFFHHRV